MIQYLIYSLPVLGLTLFALGLYTLRLMRRPSDPTPTATEAETALAKQEKELMNAIIKEAQKLVKDVPEALSIQNSMVSYYRVKPGAAGKRKRLMRFDAAMVTKTEIWLHFWGRGLPQGVSFADIKKPENKVLDNLQYAIRRPCRFYEDNDFNLYLRIGLKFALAGIPKHVPWSRAFESLPKTQQYTLAMGMSDRGTIVHQDFRRWPHIVVCGATGGGKSVMIIQWILTLIRKNTPDELRFILIDLKEGAELDRFRNMPYTLAFVEEPEDALVQLKWLQVEYKRRMAEIKKEKTVNIDGYNAVVPKHRRMPVLLLIIDELADLMQNEEADIKKQANSLLVKLARKARAAGIHMFLCTQAIIAEVLTLSIRINFPGRVAFAMPGISESILALNNSLAASIETVPGRCVYKIGSEMVILQAPIATDEEIAEAIQATATTATNQPGLSEMNLFKVSLYNLRGLASWRELWDATDKVWSANKIRKTLQDYTYDWERATPIIDIDGQQFILAPGYMSGKGPIPRRLIAVNGHVPTREEIKAMPLVLEAGNIKKPLLVTPYSDEEE